jgi:hypothetical protein
MKEAAGGKSKAIDLHRFYRNPSQSLTAIYGAHK